MKTNTIYMLLSIILGGCILLGTSCSKENEYVNVQPGNIPITFSGILSAQTKVTSTSFEKGDLVGLFATLSPSPLEEKRYINNILLTCSDGTSFTPKNTVFYPEGDVTLDFVCYHPYQATGVPEGSSTLTVSVQTDQSTKENFSKSDFLLAKKQHVSSSTSAVQLNFQHQFAKLQFSLLPGEGEDAESIQADNPRITITGVQSQAQYNLTDESITNLEEPAGITAYGTWNNEDEKLVGKEVIIIPQTLTSENHSIIMEWNGRIYTCQMPELTMEPGTQCEITITATQSGDETLAGIAGSIDNWISMEGESTDNTQENLAIHTASLSFQPSSIYRIYYQGRPLLDICKEYLKSEGLTSRAIVTYPVSKDTEQPDLTKGTVLQLLDIPDAICGGTLSWDTETNSFSYIEGDKKKIDKFYIDENGELAFTSSDNAVDCNIVSLTIRDTRDSKLQTYPIVKIGTQYWMREDLRATCYRDGTPLERCEKLEGKAGYFQPKDLEYYFYNGEVVLAGELAPEGWSIPTDKEWDALKNYINNDASVLKTGEWQLVSEEEEKGPETPAPANNLTGLSICSNGSWLNEAHNSFKKMNGYWVLDETGEKIAENIIFFTGSDNGFYMSEPIANNETFYKALSIRCIRK